MTITLIAVGKLKEEYLRTAAAQFTREIQKHCRFSLIEIPDESNENRTPEQVKRIEGEGILKRIRPGQRVIVLAIEGRPWSSEDLTRRLRTAKDSDLVFVIGGSLGLSPEVMKRADETLSISPMTFPHQLMRVMLLEALASSM